LKRSGRGLIQIPPNIFLEELIKIRNFSAMTEGVRLKFELRTSRIRVRNITATPRCSVMMMMMMMMVVVVVLLATVVAVVVR
jgi:hypothetical protein